MKAIDLYSGIGGWTLGMKLNGIDHVRSYEWNKESNTTHNHNFGTSTEEIDIRKLDFKRQLPKPGTVDIVVGSPPCTQFSYANKGGNGDIQDGLIDMYQFLLVVNYLKPKYWAMENVPRVKDILIKVLEEDERFKPFKDLFNYIEVVDSSEYGTPQRRKRMIAGNFPYKLFESYKSQCSIRTFGEIINALKQDPVIDPIYGYRIPAIEIQDHIIEEPLNDEELRLNREAKTHHPIYNKMAFPEDLNRPSRTITSTCTRVSRESLVIKDGKNFRRLTVRERGMLMGFPITYQFYGNTFNAKLKMIGNAIPPVLTYYLFQSMKEIPTEKLVLINEVHDYVHVSPEEKVPYTEPDTLKNKYRDTRSFRLAIPMYRFGSGVRFELANSFSKSKEVSWNVNFFYGSSKKFYQVKLDHTKFEAIQNELNGEKKRIAKHLERVKILAQSIEQKKLQGVWTHRSNSHSHPYDIIDELSEVGQEVAKELNNVQFDRITLESVLGNSLNQKLHENQATVLSGILVGSIFNEHIKH